MTYSVLIVDDDPALRAMYRIILERRGYIVDEAANGAEALRLLLNQTPDVIVLDILMPMLGGEAVLQRIRQMPALRDTRVLVLTAYPRFRDTASLERVDRFLVKPILPNDLVMTISEMLSLNSAQAEPLL
ncbi:MAG: response regulator [Anaerolineae bacterium]|nr:response regulator [Anaerolineae bacterium]